MKIWILLASLATLVISDDTDSNSHEGGCMMPVNDVSSIFNNDDLLAPPIDSRVVDNYPECTALCCQTDRCNVVLFQGNDSTTTDANASHSPNCLLYACHPTTTCGFNAKVGYDIFINKRDYTEGNEDKDDNTDVTPMTTTTDTPTTSTAATPSGHGQTTTAPTNNTMTTTINTTTSTTSTPQTSPSSAVTTTTTAAASGPSTTSSPETTNTTENSSPTSSPKQQNTTTTHNSSAPDAPTTPSQNTTNPSMDTHGGIDSNSSRHFQTSSTTPSASQIPAPQPTTTQGLTPKQGSPTTQTNSPSSNVNQTTSGVTVTPGVKVTPGPNTEEPTNNPPKDTNAPTATNITHTTVAVQSVLPPTRPADDSLSAISPTVNDATRGPENTQKTLNNSAKDGPTSQSVQKGVTPSTAPKGVTPTTTTTTTNLGDNDSTAPSRASGTDDKNEETTAGVNTTPTIFPVTNTSVLSSNDTSLGSQSYNMSESMNVLLLCAVAFGCVFMLAAVGVLGKRVYDGYRKRHYSRLDYLINGMYN